jgi:hypothetical protein
MMVPFTDVQESSTFTVSGTAVPFTFLLNQRDSRRLKLTYMTLRKTLRSSILDAQYNGPKSPSGLVT